MGYRERKRRCTKQAAIVKMDELAGRQTPAHKRQAAKQVMKQSVN